MGYGHPRHCSTPDQEGFASSNRLTTHPFVLKLHRLGVLQQSSHYFRTSKRKKTQKIWKWETVPCVDLRGESGPAAIWWTCGQLSFRKDPWTLTLCYFALHSYLDFLSSSVFGYTIHWTFYIKTYTIHLANRRQGRKVTSPSFFNSKVPSVIFGASQRKPAPSFGDFGATLISSWIQPMTVCSKDELCKLSCWWWNQLRVWWHEE